MSKKIYNEKENLEKENIDENEIKELIRYELHEKRTVMISENDLLYDLIKITRCDYNHAKNVFGKMKILGVDLCRDNNPYNVFNRDEIILFKFAVLRGYLSVKELAEIQKKKEEGEQREQQFNEKYGSDKSQWPNEAWEEYERNDINE